MFQQNVTLSPGTGTFTSHTFEILIMLLGAFLLGLWLGWAVWSRYREMADKLRLENMSNLAAAEELRTELNTAKTRIIMLETEATNFNAQLASLHRNNTNMRDRISELESELTAASTHIRQLETELGLSYEPDTYITNDVPLEITADDYPVATEPEEPETVVEALLELPPVEEAAVQTAPSILDIEPLPIEPTPPETRPREVTITIPEMTFNVPIANTGSINGHAEPVNLSAPPEPEPEPAPVVAPLGTSDDLTVIEGIGPKIQMLLNQYGIYTYQQLADTEVTRMKEILAAAGGQLAMHDPGTWPSQANLAANGQWEALKSIQGFLKGGKKPLT